MKTNQPLERIFHYNAQPFRTVQSDGEAWFVAVDICKMLGLAQVSRAVGRLDEDEVRLLKVTHPQNPGRSVSVNAVNEAGLYQLILSGNKPEAKLFRRWVTSEVIPALRQTGYYQLTKRQSERGNLLQFSRRDLIHLALSAEAECEKLRPKAEYFDRVADTRDSFSLGETAKLLEIAGFGRNNIIKFLRATGVLMEGNIAKQRYVDRGYFHVVLHEYSAADGELRVQAVTRVYAKGIDYIRRRLNDYFLWYMEQRA